MKDTSANVCKDTSPVGSGPEYLVTCVMSDINKILHRI